MRLGASGRHVTRNFAARVLTSETPCQTASILVVCVAESLCFGWYSYSGPRHRRQRAVVQCSARRRSANGFPNDFWDPRRSTFQLAESAVHVASTPAPLRHRRRRTRSPSSVPSENILTTLPALLSTTPLSTSRLRTPLKQSFGAGSGER